MPHWCPTCNARYECPWPDCSAPRATACAVCFVKEWARLHGPSTSTGRTFDAIVDWKRTEGEEPPQTQ
jgi:hypothetical protein